MPTNSQGLDPNQMSDAAMANAKRDTVQAAVNAPGTLQTGPVTGTTNAAPGQLPAVPTTFQAYKAPNPPLIGTDANPSILGASDATAYTKSAQSGLAPAISANQQKQVDLSKQSADLGQGLQANIERAANVEKAKILAQAEPIRENMATTQRASTLTQTAQNVQGGIAGTKYGADVMGDLTAKHNQELTDFSKKEGDLLQQAWDNAERGQVGQLVQKQNELVQVQQDAQTSKDDFYKKQSEIAAADKAMTSNLDDTIGNIIKGGNLPTAAQLDYYDQKYGLDPGTARYHTDATIAAKQVTDAKTATEQQIAAVDAAKKLSDYLDSQPTGQPVNVNGTTYIATGRGTLKTGVEISKTTGEGLAYSYDPSTHTTTTTPMGTVGFNDPNWTIEKDDSGNLWRVSANTKKMEQINPNGPTPTGQQTRLPMTPGTSQKTYNAVLPEGSTGPALPGHEVNAGQCGAYNNFCYGGPILGVDANTLKGKQQALSKYPSVNNEEIQTGNTFLMGGYGTTGHIGFVGDPVHDPNTGKLTGFMANESNFVPPNGGKVSYSRFVSINDPHLTGFYDVPTPNLPPTGGDSHVSSAASGNGPTFGAKNAPTDKPLSPTEIKAYGLDPSDPANVGLTTSGVKDALTKQKAENVNAPPDAQTTNEMTAMSDTNKTTWKNTSSSDRDIVRQMVNGDLMLKDIPARSTNSERLRLDKLALTLDPTYSPTTQTRRYEFKQQWNNPNGNSFQTRSAINSTLGHLATAATDAKALNNGELKKYNSLKNLMADQSGSEAVNNFQYDVTQLATQIATANAGGKAPSKDEVDRNINALTSNLSPQQFQGVFDRAAKLLSSNIGSLADEYKNSMGRYPDDPIVNSNSLNELRIAGINVNPIANMVGRQTNAPKNVPTSSSETKTPSPTITPEKLPDNIGNLLQEARSHGTSDTDALKNFTKNYPSYQGLVDAAQKNGKSETDILNALMK